MDPRLILLMVLVLAVAAFWKEVLQLVFAVVVVLVVLGIVNVLSMLGLG